MTLILLTWAVNEMLSIIYIPKCDIRNCWMEMCCDSLIKEVNTKHLMVESCWGKFCVIHRQNSFFFLLLFVYFIWTKIIFHSVRTERNRRLSSSSVSILYFCWNEFHGSIINHFALLIYKIIRISKEKDSLSQMEVRIFV